MTDPLRKCRQCGQEKPEQDFYAQYRYDNRSVLMTICKQCHIERVKQRTIDRKQRMERSKGVKHAD
jgi:nitrate/TMAO reductase-like tetraheme cytochrome c subunit